MRWRTLLLLLFTTALLACRSAAPPYRIVAYVRGRADIPRIGAEKLTHINYAFAVVGPSGEVVFKTPDSHDHLMRLCALKSKNAKLKVILSVGGWGADNFSDAALTEESRQKFATSLVNLITAYELDGADLDWEYPGQPGPGIRFRPEDKQNFTLLLRTIRCRLDELSAERHRAGSDRYSLSIASSAGRYFQTTEMERLHVYLDWINVMTYDFYGGKSRMTGHHTALYARAAQPGVPSTESFVRQHLAAGIPADKIVIGAAFYGRGWSGVGAANDGLQQPYEKYVSNLPYSLLTREYVDRQGFKRHWDRTAHAPYLWNADSRTLITYDDAQSIREKARYVRSNHLGGVMYWEHSHDPDEILLTVLYHNLH